MPASNISAPPPDAAPPVGVGHGGGHAVGAGDGVGLVLTGPLTTTLAVAALVLGAATAGVAILAPVLPRSRRIELVVETAAAMLVGMLVIGRLGGGMNALPLLPPAIAAIAAAALTHRGMRRTAAVAGALLLGLLVLGAGGLALTAGFSWPELARAAYIGAAALWLGSALLAAVAEPGPRRRLLSRVSAGSAAVVAATAGLRTWFAGLRFDPVSATSAAGLTTIGEVALLCGAVALAALGHRATRRGRGLVAAVLALGLTTGVAASALTPPAKVAATGFPLVRTVTLDAAPNPADPATGQVAGAEEVGVSVVPQRPGTNLVHVSAPGVLVNGVPAVARIGAPGGWAVLELPAGTRELSVERAGDRERLRLDLGDAAVQVGLATVLGGPDGPECLTAIVAASLDGRLLDSCPAQTLEPRDAAAIRAGVDFLAGRGAPRLHIISDGSPRAAAASALARRAAAARNLPVVDTLGIESAVLVVAGWDYGGRRLTQEALGLSTIYGTYTAPWLATAAILGKQTGATTILDFDPREQRAQLYLAALRVAGVTDLASTAGFRTWDGGPPESGPRVFSAAQISIFPTGVGGDDHHKSLDRWIPNGTFTPVTGPLPY